jgi:hypothetical protein
MRRAFVLLLALASLWCDAGQKRKPPKPPEVRVIEVIARRTEGLITIDGRVGNCGAKPIRRLTLLFHLRAPDGQVITTQRGLLEEEVLAADEESAFHWQMRDHARAVELMVGAVDASDNDLVVDRPGPYPVE